MMKTLCAAMSIAILAAPAFATTKDAVLSHYADLAQAKYQDSLTSALALRDAVSQLIAEPTSAHLVAAREAWVASRIPYQQSEVYRFGNAIVDDWEGQVNAWPLDEGLIDYVAEGYGMESEENPGYRANVIANLSFSFAGRMVDVDRVDKSLLKSLHELGGVEANVATGYHAIEFLLWGQDLNGTGPGAGNRPATDFDPANCSGGHCERRAAYLQAATDLLIDDLTWMVAQWGADGEARAAAAIAGLSAILTGMGSLSYGELAGERMKLGLLLHDPEEEHDCFSDNTHASHYYNALGIRNIYLGEYTQINGTSMTGPSVSALVANAAPAVDQEMRTQLDATMVAMSKLVESTQHGEAYDQMIGEGNAAGNAHVQSAINTLTAQTRSIEKIVAALGLGRLALEGSDSLDDPEAVFR